MTNVRIGKGTLAIVVILCIIGGSVATITYINGGFDWLIPGTTTKVPIEVPEEWVLNKFTFTCVKEDAVATKVTSADAFIWFDWNQDGVMQRAPFEGITDEGLVNGEIEQLASDATTGVVTSGPEYPIGKYFYVQIVKSGYQSLITKRVMFGERNSDGTAKDIGNLLVRLTDTASNTRVSASGAGLLVTSSGDYNYTTYGTAPKLTLQVTAGTVSSGFSSQTHPDFASGVSWVNWHTGKEYASTFIGMVMTNQDAIDLDPEMNYWDVRIVGASNTYFIKYISDTMDGLFYAASDSGPAIFEYSFYFDIHDAGDIASIGIYQNVELDDALIGQWSTNYLGTYETDLDFVA